MVHSQRRTVKDFFEYKGYTIVDDKMTVPMIRSYAVSTAKDHDTTIDLSKRGIILYRDKGYSGHDPKGIVVQWIDLSGIISCPLNLLEEI